MIHQPILPSLKETGKTAHLQDQTRRIQELVGKALLSTSIKEKNEILAQTSELWTPHVQELDALLNSNRVKAEELSSIKARTQDLSKKHEKLKMNTGFLKEADSLLESSGKSALVSKIEDIESEIRKSSKINQPTLLTKIPNEDPGREMFGLIDLQLRRLEELCYVYKKRLIAVEQGQELTGVVVDEFGSVNGLLEREEELEGENNSLREEERAFMADAMIRRRKTHQMAPSSLRRFAIILTGSIRSDLDVLKTYKEEFGFESKPSTDLSFSDVCGDIGFETSPTDFDQSYFGSPPDQDLVKELISPDTELRRKIELFKQVRAQVEAHNEKLAEEIQSYRDKPKPPVENGQSRAERLTEENVRLFKRIEEAHRSIDSTMDEITEAVETLYQAIQFRRSYSVDYVTRLARFKQLMHDHIQLYQQQSFNVASLETLFRFSTLACLKPINRKPLAADEYLVGQIRDIEQEIIKSLPPPPETEDPLTSGDSQVSLVSVLDMVHQKRPRRKKQTQQKTQVIETPVETPSRVPVELNLTKFEAVNSLCFTLELGGFSVGNDQPCHQAFKKLFHELAGGIESFERGQFSTFKRELSEQLNHILLVSNPMLIREKELVQVQTEDGETSDAAIQTEEVALTKKKPR